jgi:hypothetical protein
MNIKEALVKISYLRHKDAALDFLQKELERVLPNDAGTRTKEPLSAAGVSPEQVPDDVIQDVLATLGELRSTLQIELEQIERMEFTDVGKGKSNRK